MPTFSPVAAARVLTRTARTAALATLDAAVGAPFASLVTVATGTDGAPLLLLSALALHTRNLQQDARASLLIDDHSTDSAGDDRLAGSRVTVMGRIARIADAAALEADRRRFLARHPEATGYAGFADFAFYRMEVVSAHLVAGFGRIHALDGRELVRPIAGFEALAAAEPDLLVELNRDHLDALARIAIRHGRPPADWQAIGCDPFGLDLAAAVGGRRLDVRHEFAAPAASENDIRAMLQAGQSSDEF